MKRLLPALALMLLAACGDDRLPAAASSPEPTTSAQPSPAPSPAITVVKTVVTAHRGSGPPILAWALGVVPVLEARQICIALTESSVAKMTVAAEMTDEEFLRAFDEDLVPCPPLFVLGEWNWDFFGASCFPRGDLRGPSIYLQCFTFGDVFVRVKPPVGPPGEALFRVQP